MAEDVRTRERRPLEDLDAAALSYADRAARAPLGLRMVLRDEFVAQCLPFARRMAHRYRGRGEPLDDLEQVARVGLLNAVDRYDPQRGSFTAYAVVTITGELKRHFRDKAWGVHVPRGLQDLSLAAGHAQRELTTELTRAPTSAEIADRLGVDERDVAEALGSSGGYSPVSLNAQLTRGDGPAEFGDLLGGPDHELEMIDDKITAAALLRRLPARERQLLALRFYGNKTQAEIAAELGLSQMHVSRLLSRTLTWLREAMLSDAPPRWAGAEDTADPHGMEIACEVAGDVRMVRVRGEIDRDTAGRLRSVLQFCVATRPVSVVVDLSAVTLVDAGGVAALDAGLTSARSAGVDLRLAGAQPYVRHILRVAGLGDRGSER